MITPLMVSTFTYVCFILFYGMLGFVCLISFFLKEIFPFNYINAFVRILLIALLVQLGINWGKKEVKDWWNKD